MKESVEHVAGIFKALGNQSRLLIVMELLTEDCTVTHLVERTGLSQPLVSQHLKTLREVQLVKAERQGKEVHYSVADAHVAHMLHDTLDHAKEGTHDG